MVLAWVDETVGLLAATQGAVVRVVSVFAPADTAKAFVVPEAGADGAVAALAFSPRGPGAQPPAAGITGGDAHSLCAVAVSSGAVVCVWGWGLGWC